MQTLRAAKIRRVVSIIQLYTLSLSRYVVTIRCVRACLIYSVRCTRARLLAAVAGQQLIYSVWWFALERRVNIPTRRTVPRNGHGRIYAEITEWLNAKSYDSAL